MTHKSKIIPATSPLFSNHPIQQNTTPWRPLLPYGYSYKASCARPG